MDLVLSVEKQGGISQVFSWGVCALIRTLYDAPVLLDRIWSSGVEASVTGFSLLESCFLPWRTDPSSEESSGFSPALLSPNPPAPAVTGSQG